jgi:hypothetical protein
LRYPISCTVLALLVAVFFDDPWTVVRVLDATGLASAFYMPSFLSSERSWHILMFGGAVASTARLRPRRASASCE